MRKPTWILVADASKARLIQMEGDHLREVGDFTHPQGHLKNQELVSDKPGRKGSGAGQPGLESDRSPKAVEMERFAGRLGDILKTGLQQQRYDQLILVCPPRFLGCLRAKLDDQVSGRVLATLDHDYLDLSPSELLDRLRLAAPI